MDKVWEISMQGLAYKIKVLVAHTIYSRQTYIQIQLTPKCLANMLPYIASYEVWSNEVKYT